MAGGKKQRKHITFKNERPKISPVETPRPDEKARFWFQNAEVQVVRPQNIVLGAGQMMEFQVRTSLELLSISAVAPAPKKSQAKKEGGAALGELPKDMRLSVLVSADPSNEDQMSAMLEEQYGINMGGPKKKKSVKKQQWMTLGTVTERLPTARISTMLPAGKYAMRAASDDKVQVSINAKQLGYTTCLQ